MAKGSKKRKRKDAKRRRTGHSDAKEPQTKLEESTKQFSQDADENDSKYFSKLGASQIGRTSYFFFLVCVVAQLATILISWSTWEFRPVTEGIIPNLSWIAETPQFSTGYMLVASLVFAAISPKRFGLLVHLSILAVSISMDQFRCQPQILSLAFLMSACVWPNAKRLCLWYLVAMWTWAGIHKFLSPDWMSHVSCYLLSEFQLGIQNFGVTQVVDPTLHYQKLAIVVAGTEVATGLMAWFRPKLAAFMCVALHLGILLFLLTTHWNHSVIPWNLATAITGAWLLWTASRHSDTGVKKENGGSTNNNERLGLGAFIGSTLALPFQRWARVVVVLMFVMPIGFYFGWVRHCFAHSLYSNNLPLGMITRDNGMEFLESWEQLKFPFPNVQKAYRDYFRLTGKRNDKLHIREMKTNLPSHYYVHTGNNHIREISMESFLDPQTSGPLGMGIDDPRVDFEFFLNNVEMKKRHEKDMVFSVKFDPETFQPKMLEMLNGLPNLQQLELENCKVSDEDLERIPFSNRLLRIGLNGTQVTNEGLMKLKRIPNLREVELNGKNKLN